MLAWANHLSRIIYNIIKKCKDWFINDNFINKKNIRKDTVTGVRSF